MQVTISALAPPPAPLGTGSDAYTGQVDQYVSVLANDSKASTEDKAKAYQALQSLVATGTLYRLNADDLAKALDAYENSDFAKRVVALGDQYQAIGISRARTAQAIQGDGNVNGYQNQLDLLNKFSSASCVTPRLRMRPTRSGGIRRRA